MSYVQENLTPGESVIYQTRVHWVIFVPAVIAFIVAVIIMQNQILSLGFAFLAICMGVRALILTKFTEFAVTDQRIIVKTGWISRASIEIRLDKIESISMGQSVTGRMLGYGNLFVHGTGSGVTPITGIDHPLEFRKAALAAMEQEDRS